MFMVDFISWKSVPGKHGLRKFSMRPIGVDTNDGQMKDGNDDYVVYTTSDYL
jgi:hypothetical protein